LPPSPVRTRSRSGGWTTTSSCRNWRCPTSESRSNQDRCEGSVRATLRGMKVSPVCAVLVGALASSMLAGCGKAPPPAEADPMVVVAAPIVREVRDWDDYAGRFEAVDAVEIRPRVSGMLQAVHFRDGQNVHK